MDRPEGHLWEIRGEGGEPAMCAGWTIDDAIAAWREHRRLNGLGDLPVRSARFIVDTSEMIYGRPGEDLLP